MRHCVYQSHKPAAKACLALILAVLAAYRGVATARAEESRPTTVDAVGDAALGDPAGIAELVVDPPAIELSGPGAAWSILVTGRTADGREIDLSDRAAFTIGDSGVLAVSPSGEVRGIADGTTSIQVRSAGKGASIRCTVRGSKEPRLLNFENDIVPILSRFGCNSSACHGKAEGQNGFKLSVFGFDPRADFQSLAMHDRGRRLFPSAPDRSLLLRKIGGHMPHGGGVRLDPSSAEFQILHEWIGSGLRFGESTDPRVVSVEIAPRERVMGMGARQRLRVVACLSDGRRLDVTRLARFQSNDEGLATADESGLVRVGNTPGQAAIMASYMGQVDLFRALIPGPPATARGPVLEPANFIDSLVYQKLSKLNIEPSGPADDATFLRRAYLDCIGKLPTAEEARRFLTNDDPNRRARLVDELLERPEFVDFWTLVWADLLRVDRLALGHKGAYAYFSWIRDFVASNRPLDELARDIITAEGPLSESPQGHFYSVVGDPGGMASTLSQIFLGVRIACAQCHHHPFDRWSQADYYGMQAFFTQVAHKNSSLGSMVLASGDAQTHHPRTGELITAHALGESDAPDQLAGDRRRRLADWMTSADNPFFARNLANRVWAHFLGRGLVEPVDDVRLTNPPSNSELLGALADHLAKSRFDLKSLIRAITSSRTYQLSSEPNATNERDEQNYSRAVLRPLRAEVLLDALCQVTGRQEKFEGMPEGLRAVELWDSQVPHYFLKLFGRPVRQTSCECERSNEANVAQILHLMNSPDVEAKLSHEAGQVAALVRQLPGDRELVEELYLTCYGRFPSPDERATALEYLSVRGSAAAADRRQAAEDLTWSMLNSLEFVFNH